MRRFLLRLCGSLTVAASVLPLPVAAVGQTLANAGTAATPQSVQAPPSSQTEPPSPDQAAPPAATPDPLAEESRSLFAPSWNMFQLSGRVSSISGDPARWQRYQDLGDGLLFTQGRVLHETPDWNGSFSADNVGWRDQRYIGSYERIGFLKVNGLFDEIPQFYSVDTRTAFVESGDGVLLLDDNAQSAKNLNAYPPISPQFDLRESREDRHVSRQRHTDEPPRRHRRLHDDEALWRVAVGGELRVQQRQRGRAALQVPHERHGRRAWSGRIPEAMFRAAYNGSWFNNQADTLVWDNPLVLTDSTESAARAWPDGLVAVQLAADAQRGRIREVRAPDAAHRLARVRLGEQRRAAAALHDQQCAAAAPAAACVSRRLGDHGCHDNRPGVAPGRTTGGSARGSAATATTTTCRTPRFRDIISYDTSVGESTTGGPLQYAHARNTLDADATWTGFRPVALTVGYTNNHNTYDFRIFESTSENVLQLKADSAGVGWVNFRARYEYGDRNGSGLDEASLVQIGEQPAMRHYDVANRTRNRFVGQVDLVPTEALTFSVSGGVGRDEFDDSYFGLQDAGFRNVTISADYSARERPRRGRQLQLRTLHGPAAIAFGESGQPGDRSKPRLDHGFDGTRPLFFNLRVPAADRRQHRGAFRVEYAHARGNYFYQIGPALPPPSQLPETFNKLQDLRLDVRHRLTRQMVATFSYVYEPSKIFDFAFDPSVINGIVQPSSLVLGYTYRPYTIDTRPCSGFCIIGEFSRGEGRGGTMQRVAIPMVYSWRR